MTFYSLITYASKGLEMLEKTTPPPSQVEASQIEIPDELKTIVESITTAAFIALLGMNAYGAENAKIAILNNRIVINKSDMTQALKRRYFHGAKKSDLKEYGIIEIAVTYPHLWYNRDSEEARLVARIHKLTQLGLVSLQKTYQYDYANEFLGSYLKQCQDFQEIMNEEIQREVKEEPSIDFKQELSIDFSKIRISKSVFKMMKTCWALKDFEYLIELLETAHEEFKQNTKPSIGKIEAITAFLDAKVTTFREKLSEDFKARYRFRKID